MELLNLSYSQLVQYLIKKYGEVLDEFYREKSYQRFLNKEIKSITRGKYSRAKEGLYCHHILENKYENISSKDFIAHFKYPYEYHKKENLVYCDLIEHLILHVLITKETKGEYGVRGLCVYLKPTIKEWYIDEYEPKKEWMKVAKEKASLSKHYILKLFSNIDEKLIDVETYQELEESERKLERISKERDLIYEKRVQRHMQNLNITRAEFDDNEGFIIKEENLYSNRYSIFNFKANKKLSRAEVLNDLAFFLSLNKFGRTTGYATDEFKSEKINIIKEDLVEETEAIIERLKEKLIEAKYYKLEDNYNI